MALTTKRVLRTKARRANVSKRNKAAGTYSSYDPLSSIQTPAVAKTKTLAYRRTKAVRSGNKKAIGRTSRRLRSALKAT